MSDAGSNPYGLGLAKGTVRLAEPSAGWTDAYAAEAVRIRGALGELALDIQHVGSTAIPGIKAKPIVDIVVGLRQLADGVLCVEPMQAIGFEYVGVDIVPDDHIFGKHQPRTHLAHFVEHRGWQWRRMTVFRDRLRAEPALAAEYEALKLALATRFPENRGAYTAAKTEFIDAVIAR
jgi:GrpB-like predicted nucleotidyltransferase (UPF0157 family)